MFSNIYSGKRVLVIGDTGFKGAWLSLWLTRLGAKVAGYANGIPTKPSLFEILNLAEHIQHFEGDIKDPARLKEVFAQFAPEIVFHLAAKAIVKECLEDPTDAFHTNVLGTVHVLDAIQQSPSVKSAVIVTSDKCYENVEWEYGYRESDRLGGKDPYSASKAAAEIAFSSYFRSYFTHQKAQVSLYTARAGNVIGGGDWGRDRIVPDCMRSWCDGKAVAIRNPSAIRPWQHVLEPLSGYLLLGCRSYFQNSTDLSGHSFNFGPQADIDKTVLDLMKAMKEIWVDAVYTDASSANTQSNAKEAHILKLCCDKALHLLEWQAVLKFEETTAYTASWYKDYLINKSVIYAKTCAQIENYQKLAANRGAVWAKTKA